MSLLIKELLEKYNEIWERVSNGIKKGFDSELKSYEGEINKNFHSDNIPKQGSQCICLLVILIESVYRTSKNYYPQVLFKECKYVLRCLSILLMT